MLCIEDISHRIASTSKYIALHGCCNFTSASMHCHRVPSSALGMCYLHNHHPPIIHCDLNYSNLVVGKNWIVKIGDFGLCRLKYETQVTTKVEIGKPEVWLPKFLVPSKQMRSPKYIAVVLYCGKLPSRRSLKMVSTQCSGYLLVMKAAGFKNQQLDMAKDVDPQRAYLITRCLSSEPESRPTFQEILDELKKLENKFAVQIQSTAGVRELQI